ncbi:hypothetical protein H696_05737 [Fonticula alba]|uniref:Uncharacterized protein n=1 Tax=Fonticula alba TaxID=691883 RepID=A0A058Z0L1_FONAL|nr:hypothetical protein H696_05737 [Fonticula alba]KCV67795.1 hypothetical protein H696_05737 [Fonticula alba]|eukprot:XP_009497826.1 hypothetical protein H696_05737 [Fonticula alba]
MDPSRPPSGQPPPPGSAAGPAGSQAAKTDAEKKVDNLDLPASAYVGVDSDDEHERMVSEVRIVFAPSTVAEYQEEFLNQVIDFETIKDYIMPIAEKHRLTGITREVITILRRALEFRLRNLCSDLVIACRHRQDVMLMHPNSSAREISQPRRQLHLLERYTKPSFFSSTHTADTGSDAGPAAAGDVEATTAPATTAGGSTPGAGSAGGTAASGEASTGGATGTPAAAGPTPAGSPSGPGAPGSGPGAATTGPAAASTATGSPASAPAPAPAAASTAGAPGGSATLRKFLGGSQGVFGKSRLGARLAAAAARRTDAAGGGGPAASGSSGAAPVGGLTNLEGRINWTVTSRDMVFVLERDRIGRRSDLLLRLLAHLNHSSGGTGPSGPGLGASTGGPGASAGLGPSASGQAAPRPEAALPPAKRRK